MPMAVTRSTNPTRLRALRLLEGVTLPEKAVAIGIDPSTLSKAESGVLVNPSTTVQEAIERHFRLRFETLIQRATPDDLMIGSP